MNQFRLRNSLLACGALALALPVLVRADNAPNNLLSNPELTGTVDQTPEKWRSSAPDGSDALKVQADGQGAVHILDTDKNGGVGLAQYVSVQAGHKYQLSADFKGSGTLWLYLQFLDSVPAREGEISKHVLGDQRKSMSSAEEFKAFMVQAVAPAGTTKARVWFYCPKIGVTDGMVKTPALLDLGAVEMPAGTAAAAPAAMVGGAKVAGTAAVAATGATATGATATGASAATMGAEAGPSGSIAPLTNAELKDADGNGVPEGWRVFPDANGTTTKVDMTPDGVHLLDTDKTNGIGLQQQIAAQAGATYTLRVSSKGTGNFSLNFQFLSGKPMRDSDLRSLMLGNQSSPSHTGADWTDASLKATAPPGTKYMRVWLYCPKIGLVDAMVKNVRLESAAPGMAPATAPGVAPGLAPGTGTGAVVSPAALGTPAGGTAAAAAAANGHLLFVSDFENGSYDGWQTQFPKSTTGTIVTSPVRAGKYASRSELTYADFKSQGDSRNRRCEIYREAVGAPGQERWYGFSVYLPKGWEDEVFDIVMQIHNHPDPGEGPKSPIMTLETEGKNWKVNDRWDKEKISKPALHGAGGTITSNRLFEGPFETEKWTDWVFHVKWSLDDDGLIEVWKNGEKVVEHKGPNGYNDDQAYYMKIGVYKPAYRVTAPPQRVIYHDEVRIGNEHATYADVAPPGPRP